MIPERQVGIGQAGDVGRTVIRRRTTGLLLAAALDTVQLAVVSEHHRNRAKTPQVIRRVVDRGDLSELPAPEQYLRLPVPVGHGESEEPALHLHGLPRHGGVGRVDARGDPGSRSCAAALAELDDSVGGETRVVLLSGDRHSVLLSCE